MMLAILVSLFDSSDMDHREAKTYYSEGYLKKKKHGNRKERQNFKTPKREVVSSELLQEVSKGVRETVDKNAFRSKRYLHSVSLNF